MQSMMKLDEHLSNLPKILDWQDSLFVFNFNGL